MSRGDEARRLIRLMQRLSGWCRADELARELGITRRTVDRLLTGIDEEIGLVRRRVGHRVEIRLTMPEERSTGNLL